MRSKFRQVLECARSAPLSNREARQTPYLSITLFQYTPPSARLAAKQATRNVLSSGLARIAIFFKFAARTRVG
jgi:hypothetical protein